MTTKEKSEHLVSKWAFMLEGLDTHKANQITFAKVFETTAMNSNSNTIKLVLPILQRLFYTLPELKYSASPKSSIMLGLTERDLVIDGWSIMPDGALKFIDSVVANAVGKYQSEEFVKISYIRLIETMGQIQIHAYF